MVKAPKHKWAFAARFRRHAYGWRGSRTAIERLKEAVAEIKAAARKDPELGGEGAVLLLEKLSPALEQVDSSSGAIGAAVNKAIEELVAVIAAAPVDRKRRHRWLERLWQAVEEDAIPYIELLPDHWGTLCATPELASFWADDLMVPVRITWSGDRAAGGSFFKGTAACLSALLAAGRNEEILELLALAPHRFWHDRRWGVKALVAMGRKAEALRYAEESRDPYTSPGVIAEACEEILLAGGLREEAYGRYAMAANQKTTYLATFRAVAKKYPEMAPGQILADLVAGSPGNEGKWFAAARSAGLYNEAIELAKQTPCDPKTLTRAARDHRETEPPFAVEAGVAALRWLAAGYGYEITAHDVREAYRFTMEAARNAGCQEETLARLQELVAADTSPGRFVTKVLGPELGIGVPGRPW